MSKIVKNPIKEKVILGIDPGTSVMGYGLILVKGNKYTVMVWSNSLEKVQ